MNVTRSATSPLWITQTNKTELRATEVPSPRQCSRAARLWNEQGITEGQRRGDERRSFRRGAWFVEVESHGCHRQQSGVGAGRLREGMKVKLRATEVSKNSTVARKSPAPCAAWEKPGDSGLRRLEKGQVSIPTSRAKPRNGGLTGGGEEGVVKSAWHDRQPAEPSGKSGGMSLRASCRCVATKEEWRKITWLQSGVMWPMVGRVCLG